MTECVFCDIVRGTADASYVKEWDNAIAITPLNPVTRGHTLVIPRQHVADATTDPKVTALAMMRAAEIASYPCNLITSCGPDATQTVFHLHIHIVPRKYNDGLALPWT